MSVTAATGPATGSPGHRPPPQGRGEKFLRYCGEFGKLLAQVFRHRQLYFSWMERGRVFLLKFAATGPGRRVFSPTVCRVRLRPCPQGVHLRRAGSDVLVLQEIFEERIYQPVEGWSLPARPAVVDLGGNIGLATLYFAAILSESTIVVVEPEQENRRLLEMNCAGLAAAGRVKVAGCFVGGHDGVAGLDRGADSWAFRKVEAGAAAEEIECVSMPTLMRRCGLTRIAVLKCDIEGSEAELFADCGSWIRAVDFLIVETHGSYLLQDLYGDLRRAGWAFKIHRQTQAARVGLCFLEQVGSAPADARRGPSSPT